MEIRSKSLYKLVTECQTPTKDTVDELCQKTKNLEEEIASGFLGRGKPFVRIFSRFKLLFDHFTIKKIKHQLERLTKQAIDEEERKAVDALIWRAQKLGFISHHDRATLPQSFEAHTWLIRALRVDGAFSLRVVSKEEGSVELVHFSNNVLTFESVTLKEPLGVYTMSKKQFAKIDELVREFCPRALPLSQLEELALWLGAAVPLTSHVVEEKLTKLMQKCPYGAYLLYPHVAGGLVLSRLLKQGQICHHPIDLTSEIGSYTFEIGGKSFRVNRAEFKRKLEMMGTPVRIHHAP